MECIKRYNTYIYKTYPQVYFNTLDHCYYQFKEIKQKEFNKKQFDLIEKCKSKYFSCYINEMNEEIISLRFSLFKSEKTLNHLCIENENEINGEILSIILMQLIESTYILHNNNCFHGNINKNSIFIDLNEKIISLSSFEGLNKELNYIEMKEKDKNDIQLTLLLMIKEINEENVNEILEEIKQNNKERIQWLINKTNSLFVNDFLKFVNETKYNERNILNNTLYLNELFLNKITLIGNLTSRYIEYNYYYSNNNQNKNEIIYKIKPFLFDYFHYSMIIYSSYSISINRYYYDNYENNSINKSIQFLSNTNENKNEIKLLFQLKSTLENQIFSKFLSISIHQSIENNSISLIPIKCNQTIFNSILFLNQFNEIHLYCENAFRLLQIGNQIRSYNLIVKCKKYHENEKLNIKNEFSSYFHCLNIIILTSEQANKERGGDYELHLFSNNFESKYKLKDFLNVISSSHRNLFHSKNSFLWSSQFKTFHYNFSKKKNIRKSINCHSPKTIKNILNISLPDRVQSCQIHPMNE